MAKFFVSYSRENITVAQDVIRILQKRYGHPNIWYDQELHNRGGEDWWQEILKAIKNADIFVYLLSRDSIDSPYCQSQFSEAYRLQKRMIFIQVRDHTPIAPEIAINEYINMKQGIDNADTLTELYNSIDNQITKIKKNAKALWTLATPFPKQPETVFQRIPDNADVDTPTLKVPTPPSRSSSSQPSILTRILEGIFIAVVGTVAGGVILALIIPRDTTLIPTPTPIVIPRPTLSPEEQALQRARDFASITNPKNSDWTRYEQDFNGITMVLVPAGCFMMGSTDGNDDEKPLYKQCFDEPFWIDKYEVSQAQFVANNGTKANANSFTGDDLPVEQITWFEARNYCNKRGASLPTEAKWEYAARGPSNLAYPWGAAFGVNDVVYKGNSNNQTAPVGSRPSGASWVGALDMSGNVWEWVSSWYAPYPYFENDGRESVSTGDRRVLRGGSWFSVVGLVRSALRYNSVPTDYYYYVGFRCVRSL